MRAGCCVYTEIGLQRSGLVTSAGVQCAANINSDPGLFISGPSGGGWQITKKQKIACFFNDHFFTSWYFSS